MSVCVCVCECVCVCVVLCVAVCVCVVDRSRLVHLSLSLTLSVGRSAPLQSLWRPLQVSILTYHTPSLTSVLPPLLSTHGLL